MANYNLDVTYGVAIDHFKEKDPSEMAFLSGCLYDATNNQITVDYLDEKYFIKHPNGEMVKDGGGEIDLKVKILLLHYLTFASGQPVMGQWISYKELPDGYIYIDPFTRRVISPMLKLFSDKFERFHQLALALGGKKEELGDLSVTINVLPKVPITYVLYEADEEFEASGNVLFDASAPHYLPTEDYALVSQLVILKMKDMP